MVGAIASLVSRFFRENEVKMLDSYWIDAIDFLNKYKNGKNILVPNEMVQHVSGAKGFGIKSVGASNEIVLCIHKGLIAEIHPDILFNSLIHGEVVFANEVFAIYAPATQKTPDANQKHLGSMIEALSKLFRPSEPSQKVAAASGRTSTYLGNETLLTTLRAGQKIYLDSSDISLTPHIVLDGYWEEWITTAFLRELRPGMRVVDIGANCGYYTLLACSAVGPTGSVIAIDANPRMTSLVHNSVSVNGFLDRATVINAAVHEAEGTIDLAIPKRFKGSATTVTKGFDLSSYQDSFDLISVRSAPLDKLLSDSPVDVMKIDAEGAEPMIVRGSEAFFRNSRKLSVLMEFSPAFFADSMSGAAFLDQIEGLGFRIKLIKHDGSVINAARDQILSMTTCDLFLEK